MDYDDPLGSDDSFFEEPKALNKRGNSPKKGKKTVENLFNITDIKTGEETIKNVAQTSEKVKNPIVTFEEPLPKQDTFANPGISESLKKTQKKNEDWLFGDSDTLEKKTKKTDFLEDILSVRPSSSSKNKVTSFDDILKGSKFTASSKSSDKLKDTPAATEVTSNFSLLSNASKERRKSRRGSSTAVEDALGLFSNEYQSGDYYTKDKKETPAADFQTKTNRISDKGVPDWLGGSTVTPHIEIAKENERDAKDFLEIGHNRNPPEEEQKIKKFGGVKTTENDDLTISSKQQQINVELQNTYASLQQQETMLLISLQLKKYEDNLEEVKQHQQEIMEKQEKYFNTLMDRYVLKQQLVDNNVRQQQERINNHMQMLLSNSLPNISANSFEEKNKVLSEYTQDFDNIISTLKQRHQEELFIIEESYKKQISLLEKSNEALEQKLGIEAVNISKMFENKIDTIIKNYDEETLFYKQKIHVLEEQHNNEIRLLKENHIQTIEELKTEHKTQIEYLKEFKQKEIALLNDGIGYSQKLDANLEILNGNTKVLQVVQDKLTSNYDIISVARENSIQAKEKEIILMRNALEKCREASENERSQLLALIRSLETKIAEQNNNAREERWALQQASATLVARAAALDREAEYNRTLIERERDQLKTFKESLLAEQEKNILGLTEEKLKLSAEKAKAEVSSKLINNYESERIKAEAESAIQVAKDLTLKVNQEREYLHRQKNEIEVLKRSLADREGELEEKRNGIGIFDPKRPEKINEDKKIVNEAKKIENRYKEQLQELKNQWVLLSNREKKLAEEKVLLSKERLALYTTMKQTRGCVLCKTNDNDPYNEININEELVNNKVSDPDTVRFRLDIMEDEKNSEVSKEENNIFYT